MYLSRCVKQILVLHYPVRRGLVGSYRQDLARRQLGMAPHLRTMLWATKAVYTLSQCFPVSREGGCEGKRSYKVTFMDQEDVMCGSIWGTIGFLSLKQISAFKHQWNTNKQNTASISTRQQYHPFCGYCPEGRLQRVTLNPENQLASQSVRQLLKPEGQTQSVRSHSIASCIPFTQRWCRSHQLPPWHQRNWSQEAEYHHLA